MSSFVLVLRLCAVAIVAAALCHLIFGAGANRLLDPGLPASITSLASVDSQDRFYGTAFSVYGVLLWHCSRDLARRAEVLRMLLLVFFASGLTRLVSIAIVGWPSPAVLALAIIEITAPPLLEVWRRFAT